MILVQVQFETGIKYGLEISEVCGKKIETESQKF